MIDDLEQSCVDFLVANLNTKSVVNAVEKCLSQELSPKLLEECRKYIQTNMKVLLKDWESMDISHGCLIVLLEQETVFTVQEVDRFQFVSTICDFTALL